MRDSLTEQEIHTIVNNPGSVTIRILGTLRQKCRRSYKSKRKH